MSVILGVSGLYHDAAAALVVDGAIAIAIQEERLSRVKNDPSLPLRAIQASMEYAKITPADIDSVVFYEDPFAKLERTLVSTVRSFPRGRRHFSSAMEAQLGRKMWALDAIAEAVGVDRSRVTFTQHHRSHAVSAYYTSGYDDAAVLTVDGVGEEACTALWHGEAADLRLLAEQRYPHSLGMFYAAFTAYCGFRVNEGEQKLMGLSAYGVPRYRDEIDRTITIGADGSIELCLDYFDGFNDVELGFGPKLEALLGPRRAPGQPWTLEEAADRRFADVAATVQALTEEAILAMAREAKRRTGATALCLAGGVALNAVANARLTEVFERVYVHPAAGDAGGALGAALDAAGGSARSKLRSAALGLPVDAAEASSLARTLGLEVRRVADPAALVAEQLARGRVVAFVAGRDEWGPRALGQRSLLAPAGPAEVRAELHRTVKEREPFRPFAPAALAERAGELFDEVHEPTARFMTSVCRLKAVDPRLGAVVHVDGTARVQAVYEDSAPDLHRVLRSLHDSHGVDAILNTSLNAVGEPLCSTAMDAIAFYLAHPVDALVVEDLLITRDLGRT